MLGGDSEGWARGAERTRRLLRRATGTGGAGPSRPEPTGDDTDQRGIDAVIGDCGVYQNGHRLPGRIPLDRAAEAARGTQGFVWIGLQQPTAEDIATVADEFGLPSLAVEDAVKAHQRPKLDVYDDVVFVVLKPVRYVDHEEVVDVSEIALFLGPDFVVTVRHGHSDVLGRVRAELDRGGSEVASHGPTAVLYRTADLVVDGYEEAIASITEDVDEIESQVFGGDEEDHAERIYKLKREVAEFRRAVLPLAQPLHWLAEGTVPFVDKAVAPYFRDVHDHLLKMIPRLETFSDLLTSILSANLTKVTVRQNEDMRRISAWVAIAAVPTMIAGIYGMNFEHMPELSASIHLGNGELQYGYFLVLGVMAGACIGLYRAFKRSGWL